MVCSMCMIIMFGKMCSARTVAADRVHLPLTHTIQSEPSQNRCTRVYTRSHTLLTYTFQPKSNSHTIYVYACKHTYVCIHVPGRTHVHTHHTLLFMFPSAVTHVCTYVYLWRRQGAPTDEPDDMQMVMRVKRLMGLAMTHGIMTMAKCIRRMRRTTKREVMTMKRTRRIWYGLAYGDGSNDEDEVDIGDVLKQKDNILYIY